MRIAYWINKAPNTHSEYVVAFIAFPLQQWLHELSPVLRTLPVLLLLRHLPIVARNARQLRYICTPVCPSDDMYQWGSHWKDFREI